MTTDQITPLQRARMKAALDAVRTGKKKIPLLCGYCRSTNVYKESERSSTLLCAACGRRTSVSFAHTDRKQRIAEFIREGIDVAFTRMQKAKAER